MEEEVNGRSLAFATFGVVGALYSEMIKDTWERSGWILAVDLLMTVAFCIITFGYALVLGYSGGMFDPIITRFGMKPRGFGKRKDHKNKP